jgi:putative salt-induced outer membrane protein YdiY
MTTRPAKSRDGAGFFPGVRRRAPRVLALLVFGLAVASAAAGQTEAPLPSLETPVTMPPPMAPEAPTPAESQHQTELFGAPSWSGPGLSPRQFDWIRLTNGEWLKGKITVLRTDTLQFDSDEFGDLSIDWEKIDTLRTARPYTFGFTRRRAATGRALITPEQVLVKAAEGDQVFDRKDLYSIVRAERSWWTPWQGKISAGATVRSGNTNQVDANAVADIKRQTAFTRLSLSVRANFGSVEEETNVQNLKTDLAFDIFLTERFYVTPASMEVYRDQFQNIKVRYSPGVGIGYELVDDKRLTWNVQLGAVYRGTHSISSETGAQGIERTGAITAGSDWESTLTSRIDFDGSYDVSIGIPSVSDTNQNVTAVLSVELNDVFDLDLSFVWNRVGDPTPTESNETPEKDDFTLTVGIGIDF